MEGGKDQSEGDLEMIVESDSDDEAIDFMKDKTDKFGDKQSSFTIKTTKSDQTDLFSDDDEQVSDESGPEDDGDSLPTEAPSIEKQAEIALLTFSDDPKKNKKSNVKLTEESSKKSKRQKMKDKIASKHKDSSINLDDDRFSAVYDNPDFSVDPTVPEFKKTEGMTKLMKEKSKRKGKAKEQNSECVDLIAERFRKRRQSSEEKKKKKSK
ncbi:hypothetical protein GEMRC1_007542 [Eukaryota sp. GEM-RC1]